MLSWSDMIVNLLLWSAQRSFWAAQISVCQCVARLWKETSTACLQLCLKWTLVVLCYSARPCYDIVTCCCADEMKIVSIIWSLFSCAYLTFITRCTLCQIWAPKTLNITMCHAFLTLWLIWIMLNRCGEVLLVSLTTLPRSYNSVPAGLFIWIELLSYWPSLVSGPTWLQTVLKLVVRQGLPA